MIASGGSGREFTGWKELRFAITELQYLAARLGTLLHAADEDSEAIVWDQAA